MKNRSIAAVAAAVVLLAGAPAVAQTTHETKVDHDTSVKNGVATTKTRAPKPPSGKRVSLRRFWA